MIFQLTQTFHKSSWLAIISPAWYERKKDIFLFLFPFHLSIFFCLYYYNKDKETTMGRSSRRPLSAVPFFSALRRMWHHHSVMSHTSPSTSSFAPSTSPQPQSSQSQTL